MGPSHIPTAERNLLLKCLLKVGILLESKPGNQLPSREDLGYTRLLSSSYDEPRVPLDMGW